MKTVLGYLIRLLGILFAISFIGGIFSMITSFPMKFNIALFEKLAGVILAFFLARYCFKCSKKMLSKKENVA